jgi:hypothetical protein
VGAGDVGRETAGDRTETMGAAVGPWTVAPSNIAPGMQGIRIGRCGARRGGSEN